MAARLLFLIAALGLAASQAASGPAAANPLESLGKVSEEEERSLGEQVDASIQSQAKLIDDAVVLGFVSDLGQRIVQTIEPQPFVYRFRVVNQRSLNAFALPGGYVYFHSGTILEAASLDELAGVMGHEIAHVRGRHYARGAERSFWPNLLAQAAGIAATLAAGDSTPMLAAQGINVALQLRYTREFEAEADDFGSAFMARAGFDPRGMGRFFERIVHQQEIPGLEIPPYLYSHPDVEDRIAAVEARAPTITITPAPREELEVRFRQTQARLEWLIENDRTRIPIAAPTASSKALPLLREADEAEREGDFLLAMALLERAQREAPEDPRPPFRRGELLYARGRIEESIPAFRRAVELHPEVALSFYRLGTAYQRLGERHVAAYYLEQAARRFEPGGKFQQRTRLALSTLSFPPVQAAGLADGRTGGDATTVAGYPRERFTVKDERVVWWALTTDRYALARGRIRVRFLDPTGEVVAEKTVESRKRGYVVAAAEIDPTWAALPGTWRVEALLEDQVIDRRRFELARSSANGS